MGVETVAPSAISRPQSPLQGEPDMDLAFGRRPGLPDGLPAREELEPDKEDTVRRAGGVGTSARPLPQHTIRRARRQLDVLE